MELYVRCLSRKPTREELDKLLPNLRRRGQPGAGLSRTSSGRLLNSREFLFNH